MAEALFWLSITAAVGFMVRLIYLMGYSEGFSAGLKFHRR